MRVPGGNRDLLKVFQKTKTRFVDVCGHVRFIMNIMNRDEEVRHMEHYFNRMQPIILNENNIDTLYYMLNQFIDKVKDELKPGLKEARAGRSMKYWKFLSTWHNTNHCEAGAIWTCHES